MGALSGSRYLNKRRTGRTVDVLNQELASGVLQRQMAARQQAEQIDADTRYRDTMTNISRQGLDLDTQRLGIERDQLGLAQRRVEQEQRNADRSYGLDKDRMKFQKEAGVQNLGASLVGMAPTIGNLDFGGLGKIGGWIGNKLGIGGGGGTTSPSTYSGIGGAFKGGGGFFSSGNALKGAAVGGTLASGLGMMFGKDKKKGLLAGGLGALVGAGLGGFNPGGFFGKA